MNKRDFVWNRVNLIQVSIQEATLDVSSLEEEKVTFYEPDDEERSPSTRPASPPQASPSPCPPAATPSPRPPSVHVMPPSPRPPSVMEEPPTEPEEDKVEHTEKAGKEEQYHSGDEGGKCFCRPESSRDFCYLSNAVQSNDPTNLSIQSASIHLIVALVPIHLYIS